MKWTDIVTAFGTPLTILVAVAALWMTQRENLESREIDQKQMKLVEQGQITDRFTKAVEQIGSGKADIEIGGAYALERIMVDSPTDQPAVISVLSAHLRISQTTTTVHQKDYEFQRVTQTTQTILDILGRRPDPGRKPFLDLSGASLPLAHLQGANLLHANLTGADLTDSDLTGVNLQNADLTDAVLNGASLDEADLSGANLFDANMIATSFIDTDLTNASLLQADLTGAKLTGAKLTGTRLTGADLTRVDLAKAVLTGCIGCTRSR